MFNTTYPIVLAGMNPVCDVNLAVACSKAGMMPTLCGFIYYRNGNLNNQLFEQGLIDYCTKANTNNLIPSLDGKDILNPETVRILLEYNIHYVELIEGIDKNSWPIIRDICAKNQITPIIKILHYDEILDGFSVVMLKGFEGAGRGNNKRIPLLDLLIDTRKLYPDLKIIVSGGIGSGIDIEKYLNNGADAVAIGTLFAASTESCLSDEAKMKIVQASSKDLVRLGNANQNALVFSKIENDDFNNTKSIRMGIKSGSEGHLFLGSAVDQVNKIETVSTILSNLLKDTRYEKTISNNVAFTMPYP